MKRQRVPSPTPFYDFLQNTLLVFMILFIISFLLIKVEQEKKRTVDMEGEFVITIKWPGDLNDDVDTYVEDPEGHFVYFQRREDGLLHLERDDQGKLNDTIQTQDGRVEVGKNEERVIIRGVIAGEYVVNVHMWRKEDGNAVPTPVSVTLTRLKGIDSTFIEKTIELHQKGDERTVFRFTLDSSGGMTETNDLQKRFTGNPQQGTAPPGMHQGVH